MNFLKVLSELTYNDRKNEKAEIETVKTGKGFKEVKAFSYTGSVVKKDLMEKGNFTMNVFKDDILGRKAFLEECKKDTFASAALVACNNEAIRLAQNANRTWDKISASAQAKNAGLALAKSCIAGKYGTEAQATAKAEFPFDKFPTLY